jgi:hypothetical protein
MLISPALDATDTASPASSIALPAFTIASFEAGPSRAPEAVMEDVSALEMCSA